LISFLYIYLAKRIGYDRTLFSEIINNFMRILEIEQTKTPQHQRLAQFQPNSKRASNAVKSERNRQKMLNAQKAIQTLNIPCLASLKIPT